MQVPIKRPRKNTEFRPEYSQGILSRAWKKHNQIIRKSILHKAQHYKPGWTVEKTHLGLLWAFSSATKLKIRSERKHQEKKSWIEGRISAASWNWKWKSSEEKSFLWGWAGAAGGVCDRHRGVFSKIHNSLAQKKSWVSLRQIQAGKNFHRILHPNSSPPIPNPQNQLENLWWFIPYTSSRCFLNRERVSICL